MSKRDHPILSVAIPTYNRCAELDYSLRRMVEQCAREDAGKVEVWVTDDCSTDDTADVVRAWEARYPFMHFRRNPENIGLERNLIECTRVCRGDFLWIFGDDDYLECDDALTTVLEYAQRGEYDCLVVNRTRRSFDLSRLLTPNWMRIDENRDLEYVGLREFCLRWGFISIIGFITVNIFRRRPFSEVDAGPFYNTMYPQLGMMLEAFSKSRTRLLARPLICHRTQTQEEKRVALGHKVTEKDFMSDVDRRNAIYFCFPLIDMLDRLAQVGAFSFADIAALREHTVINGLLTDFLLNNIDLVFRLDIPVPRASWEQANRFFEEVPLTNEQRRRWASQYAKAGAALC